MIRVPCALVLAGLLATSCCNTVWADGFSFSVGGGHGHRGHSHHHHHHGWSPHVGFSIWSPPPPRYVYVAPPIVQERIYVQPPVVQERVIIEQQPRASTYESLPAPPANTTAASAPVIIRNKSGRGIPVAFLLDGRNANLADGHTQSFAGSSHTIAFDRGGELGTMRYELASGLYSFVVGEEGWELVRESSAARVATNPSPKRNELPSDPRSR